MGAQRRKSRNKDSKNKAWLHWFNRGGASKTHAVQTTWRLQHHYRISYTRWTPGKFSSLPQRIVTCPWMRQSFSLPQCSVQCPLPLPLTHSPPQPPPAKHATRRHFWLGKMAHLESFHLSVSFLFSLLDCCLSSNSKIYLFSLLPLEGTNNLNFKEIKRPPLQFCFVLFRCRNGSTNAISRWKGGTKAYAFSGTFQEQT